MRERGVVVAHVFHRDGRPTRDLADAWKAACLVAELKDRRFHDLRRYACARMIRAGLAPTEAMALMGHKTLSMHLRYGIVDLPMLERAVAKVAALDGVQGCDTDKSTDKSKPAPASACESGSEVVPGARLELARVSPYAPQTYVSTSSTTRARNSSGQAVEKPITASLGFFSSLPKTVKGRRRLAWWSWA